MVVTGFDAGPGRDVGRYVGISIREGDDLHMVGRAPVTEHLRDDAGRVRAGALLMMLDNVGGVCGGLAALPDGWLCRRISRPAS